MRPELEDIQLLEAYLHHTLDENKRIEVEIRLLWDQEWQQKVALQKSAYLALRQAGRQQLRRELQAIHTRLFGK
ncbi:hypothetical protein GXP67_18890 [Rhodocytophaga rosea]|uniref:Uncharacterized protein n=1 Tax=Rhodocytophaga rosea TaxID=2704465 RepID=A0A6C0GLP3_9BACT|nr:hypothetical protein [Rhodocytophaga rosea]QHT68563.1 hypothetical protein GXP67_18890 [Rhodocytophaga rosea]